MAVSALDHVNIQTARLAETAAFYRDVLGLEERDPPANLDPALIRWMADDAGRPILHLTMPGTMLGEAAGEAATGSGAIHHVALDCSGYAAMIDHLDGLGVERRTSHVPAINLRQIFVHDPNGVLIELNFRNEPGG